MILSGKEIETRIGDEIIIDPYDKNRINPKDSQRIQRAYEVKLKTKKSMFDWFTKTKSDFLDFDLRKVFIDIFFQHK